MPHLPRVLLELQKRCPPLPLVSHMEYHPKWYAYTLLDTSHSERIGPIFGSTYLTVPLSGPKLPLYYRSKAFHNPSAYPSTPIRVFVATSRATPSVASSAHLAHATGATTSD